MEVSKSGTFRAVGLQHEEAIEILRGAFEEGGVYEGRRITELAEAMAKIREDRLRDAAGRGGQTGVGIEGELMEDSGILGILDKIVATRAGLFVTGGKGCGRVSSLRSRLWMPDCAMMRLFRTLSSTSSSSFFATRN